MSEKKRASQGKQDFDAYDALLAAEGSAGDGKQPSAAKKSAGKSAGKAKASEGAPAKKRAGTAAGKGGKKKPKASEPFDELDEAFPAAQAKKAKKKPKASEPYDELDEAFAGTAKGKKAASGKSGEAAAAKGKKSGAPKEKEQETDPYDALLATGENKEAAAPARKRKGGGLGMAAVLMTCILALVGLGIRQVRAYSEFLEMRRVVEQQTFYEGTSVDGVDVSGMSLDEALIHWETNVEPAFESVSLKIEGSESLSAIQLGYASDYREVLRTAWSAGRAGGLEQRYKEVTRRKDSPTKFVVHRRLYSEDLVDQYVQALADAVDTPAQDAHIKSFDVDKRAFVFAESREGRELDQKSLRTDMISALNAGGGSVTPVVNSIAPEVTKADIESSYGMITSAVTSASSSSANRLNNIDLALSTINGTCLKPGDTFSFNTVVGKRTTDRGYKKAPAFSSGEVTQQVGGGICQVSTTVFNAAVKSDLEIVERHNHSIPVGYVDKGKDATVDWGVQDLRFRNTSDDNIYLCCYLTDKKRVMVEVYGKLLPDGQYITVEAYTTGTLHSETEYRTNTFLSPGKTNVIQEGRTGYTASAYKVRWSASDEVISRELLCTSRYPARNTIIERAG